MQHWSVILDVRSGEGPVWDELTQQLYWVDIVENRIHHGVDSSRTSLMKSIALDQSIGSFAFREHGGIVAALENGFHYIDLLTAQTTLIHNPFCVFPDSSAKNNFFFPSCCSLLSMARV